MDAERGGDVPPPNEKDRSDGHDQNDAGKAQHARFQMRHRVENLEHPANQERSLDGQSDDPAEPGLGAPVFQGLIQIPTGDDGQRRIHRQNIGNQFRGGNGKESEHHRRPDQEKDQQRPVPAVRRQRRPQRLHENRRPGEKTNEQHREIVVPISAGVLRRRKAGYVVKAEKRIDERRTMEPSHVQIPGRGHRGKQDDPRRNRHAPQFLPAVHHKQIEESDGAGKKQTDRAFGHDRQRGEQIKPPIAFFNEGQQRHHQAK